MIGYDVWASPDGKRWERTTPTHVLPARVGAASVVLGKELLVFGGWKPSGGMLNDVWATRDGKTWGEVTQGDSFPARNGHAAVVYKGSVWLLFGWDTKRCREDIWVARDGRGFSELQGSRKLATR